MDLYPDFPFAHFEAAMVHIARGALDRAEPVLREGTIVQDRQADLRQRYPAKGLHWLLGLVRLARGDAAKARASSSARSRRARGSCTRRIRDERLRRRGFACLHSRSARGRRPATSAGRWSCYPEHARSLVGLGARTAAIRAMARVPARRFDRAAAAIGRSAGAGAGARRCWPNRCGMPRSTNEDASLHALHALLDHADLPFAGWTVPIEPLLDRLRESRRYAQVADRLAERAR